MTHVPLTGDVCNVLYLVLYVVLCYRLMPAVIYCEMQDTLTQGIDNNILKKNQLGKNSKKKTIEGSAF